MNYNSYTQQADPFSWGLAFVILFVAVLLIVCMIGAILTIGPHYHVWSAKKQGEADLAQAQSEKMIQVAQAQGRVAAAEMNKQAAVIEAEAVKAQISVIGEGLKEHGLYLQWQWIKMMEERDGATIYVPTEAGIPILERRRA